MAVATETVRDIVAVAALAPTGDNSQPFRFRWDGERLHIGHDDGRGEHPFNSNYTLSYLGLGCMLEALEIAAASQGLAISVELNDPLAHEASSWAEITFSGMSAVRKDWSSALRKRCTDRRLYRGGSLESHVFKDLAAKITGVDHVRLHLRPPSDELVDYLTEVETLIWTWAPSQQGIAKWFRLSRREARARRDGMTRQSMAVDPVSALLLRLSRADFRYQRILNTLGFLSMFRSRVRERVRSSAAIGCVTVDGVSMETVVGAARVVMRAWLVLNAGGYGFQALSAASELILDHSRGLLPRTIPRRFHDVAAEGRVLLGRVFELGEYETPAWIFRTGLAQTPPNGSASPRLPVSELLTFES